MRYIKPNWAIPSDDGLNFVFAPCLFELEAYTPRIYGKYLDTS